MLTINIMFGIFFTLALTAVATVVYAAVVAAIAKHNYEKDNDNFGGGAAA